MKDKNSSSKSEDPSGFIQIPFSLSNRTDFTWCEKAILGYMFTRSNIEKVKWTISSPDIQNLLGISRKQVVRIIQKLETAGVITFSQMMVGQGHPFKTYSINSKLLKEYMGLRVIKSLCHETKGQEVPKTKGHKVPLEEDKNIKEDIRIKEDSTNISTSNSFIKSNINWSEVKDNFVNRDVCLTDVKMVFPKEIFLLDKWYVESEKHFQQYNMPLNKENLKSILVSKIREYRATPSRN